MDKNMDKNLTDTESKTNPKKKELDIRTSVPGHNAIGKHRKYEARLYEIENLPRILLEYCYLHAIGETDTRLLFTAHGSLYGVDRVNKTNPNSPLQPITASTEEKISAIKEKYGNILELPYRVIFD